MKVKCCIPGCKESNDIPVMQSVFKSTLHMQGDIGATSLLEGTGFVVRGGMSICKEHKGRYTQIRG